MKLHWFAKLVTITTFLITWPAVSTGSVIVSLYNPGSTTLHEVTVSPGETFNVDLTLTAIDEGFYVLWFGIQASASNVFDVTQVTASLPWGISGIGESLVLPSGLDSVSNFVVGHSTEWPGSSTMAVFQFSIDSGAPVGTYIIDVINAGYVHSQYTYEAPLPAIVGPAFEVRVVPEPASIAMLLLLALFLPRRRLWTTCNEVVSTPV